jgi:DNA-binding MarR family transcriptional regulator
MTSPATTSATDELVRQLYRLTALQRQLFRHALSEIGAQSLPALAAVHQHGPLRVSDIAGRLAVDLSVASRQVRSLVDAGHLRREADLTDRRAQLVAITASGEALLEDAHARMVGAFERVVEGWDADDVTHLTAGLTRLREGFEKETCR